MNITAFYKLRLIKGKLWEKLVQKTKKHKVYVYLYKSYWHYRFNKKAKSGDDHSYFAAQPNKGAGIGHQMANWIAGLWFAKLFGLRFAHIPFSNKSWELFLGFGKGEISVSTLVNEQGFKKIKLPLFDETKMAEIDLTKKIIRSYQGEKVIFLAEQDQFYRDQIGVIPDLQDKFYGNHEQRKDRLIYANDVFNIAIHVRRGDISTWKQQRKSSSIERWQSNDYFVNTLTNVIRQINTKKPIRVYLFSQGELTDFTEFEQFRNVEYCLDMSAQESFLHMVYADVLITSRSSFSYKPALLNKGLKIVPPNFWHGYPETDDWIIASEDGQMVINRKEI